MRGMFNFRGKALDGLGGRLVLLNLTKLRMLFL